MIAQTIEAWENQLPEFIKLAYLPSPGRVRLRLTARGNDEALLKKAMQEEITKVTPLIQHILVGMEEEESIEQADRWMRISSDGVEEITWHTS